MGFLISTKGRYALRVMADLARNPDSLSPLKEIAERQGISLKYLENIMPCLKEAGFVTGTAGKGGGYRLSRPPGSYTVGEILRATEGAMAPVACLGGGFVCGRAEICPTLRMWRDLDRIIRDYLDAVRLTDLGQDPGGDLPAVPPGDVHVTRAVGKRYGAGPRRDNCPFRRSAAAVPGGSQARGLNASTDTRPSSVSDMTVQEMLLSSISFSKA